MNERIKQLAKQSLPEFYLTNCPSALEKFAELIVAECILTIQMGITRDGPNTEKYLRSMKHIKQIREHFGVEE
jgi:hypothetical protein